MFSQDELTPEPDGNYELFGRLVLQVLKSYGSDFFEDEWSEVLLPSVEKAGLAERVKYDPAIHGDEISAEEGDEIWVWK